MARWVFLKWKNFSMAQKPLQKQLQKQQKKEHSHLLVAAIVLLRSINLALLIK